jgi:hypothetical protein
MSHTLIQPRGGLESIVQVSGPVSSEEIQDLQKSDETIDVLKQWYQEYKDNGKLNRQVIRGMTQGYNFREPAYFGASTDKKDAVAWTFSKYDQTTGQKENVLGINTYVQNSIDTFLNNHPQLNYEQAKEYLLAHEINHMMRHNTLKPKTTNDMYKIEIDNELDLHNYFTELANSTDDTKEKQNYTELAEVAAARYIGQIAAYAKQNGIEINLEQMAKESGLSEKIAETEQLQKAA